MKLRALLILLAAGTASAQNPSILESRLRALELQIRRTLTNSPALTNHVYGTNVSGAVAEAIHAMNADTAVKATYVTTAPLTNAVTNLPSIGTAGTYRSVTFDAQGRETSGSNPTTFSGYAISDSSANFFSALIDRNGFSWANLNGTNLVGTITNNTSGNAATATSATSATSATTATYVTTTPLTNAVTNFHKATIIVAATNSANKLLADYTCTGTADHLTISNALLALPAAGGVVQLLEGSYWVSGSINVSNRQHLIGQGYATKIQLQAVTTSFATIAMWTGDSMKVANLHIDGTAAQSLTLDGPQQAIAANLVTNSFIEGNWIEHMGNVNQASCIGINPDGCYDLTIVNNWITDTVDGINTSAVNDIPQRLIVTGNHLTGISRDYGLYLFKCNDSIFTGNTINGAGKVAIHVNGSSRNLIAFNTCTNYTTNSTVGIVPSGILVTNFPSGSLNSDDNILMGNIVRTGAVTVANAIVVGGGSSANRNKVYGNDARLGGTTELVDSGTSTQIALNSSGDTGTGRVALSNAPSIYGPTINSATASRFAVFDSSKRLTNDIAETGSGAPVRSNAPSFYAPKVNSATGSRMAYYNSSLELTNGTLAAADFPALTGDVTTSAGSLATTLAAGNAGNLNSGTLAAGRMPALTGDITTSAGSVATTLAAGNAGNLNSGTLAAGRMPALTGDITTSAGSVATTLAAGNAANLNSGTLAAGRMPALTGDVTTSAGSVATTVTTAKWNWAGTSGNTALAANTTYFFPPNNSNATLPTADASGGTRAPVTKACTLQNLYVVQSVASGSGKTISYTIMTNGVASSIVASITGTSALTGNDTTHTETLIAGVEVGLRVITPASSGTPKICWGWEAK